MLLAPLLLAWLVGIIATDMLALPLLHLAALALLSLVGAIALGPHPMRIIALALFCAALGGIRYDLAQVSPSPQSVWLLAEQGDATILGSVAADPRHTDRGQQVLLETRMAHVGERSGAVEGLLLLNVAPYPAYHYGQRLHVWGRVERPAPAARPGTFDYRDYLARKSIFATMRDPLIQVQPGSDGLPLQRMLLDLRNHCKALLLRMLPEPQASIGVGMLLGLRSSIPQEVYARFSATGTSHVLVISGWHLTIVATVYAAVASRLRLRPWPTFWSTLAVIWLYAMFVGATPTVLRAALMASLAVLATATSRRTEPWTLLLIVCWVLTLWDPQMLWDIGFQLSALATASLFGFHRSMQRWLLQWRWCRSPASGWIVDALSVTLAAQVLVLPIILYHFGNLSMIAPVANVLMAPVVPWAMLFGAVALVGGLIWLPVGQGLAIIAWLPFAAMAEITRLLSALPWASVQLPPLPLWSVLGYYVLVTAWWWFAGRYETFGSVEAVGAQRVEAQSVVGARS
ncbi:MAG: ComEC family competence protein [Chloroflexaceae bacterium]|nr:ComEC family competence protein [Chloroflexaceae bacterium]